MGVVVLKRIILSCILGLLSLSVAGEPSNDAALRVAFVQKFIKFIEWPDKSLNASLRLCALGALGNARDALGLLDKQPVATRVVEGKPVVSQVIELVFLDDPNSALEQLTSCQMIYRPLGGVPIALPTPLPTGVVFVADNPNPYEANVAIALTRNVEGRMEFAISQVATKQAGVTMSSQLLKLATYRRGGR